MPNTIEILNRGEGVPERAVSWPPGFSSSATTCGLKESGHPDLAILVSQPAGKGAGVFTCNQFKAAPVLVSQAHLQQTSRIAGVVINSGNANAGTGEEGMVTAQAMTAGLAQKINCLSQQVLVMSTGVIGKKLPLAKVQRGIQESELKSGKGSVLEFAKAMMTTDTQPKAAWLKTPNFEMVGVAKGSGMIHPNMATMLAVIATDASMNGQHLKEALRDAVDASFHRISVDGAMSTNDAVVLLANGSKGVDTSIPEFQEALNWVCRSLARQIVADGEGASKILEITVAKGRNEKDCVQIAKTIAGSLLVKTACFGEDPNWGRILAAAGQAGVDLDIHQVDLFMGPIALIHQGEPIAYSSQELKQIMKADTIPMTLVLNQGSSQATYWTNDLTYRYVEINAEYTT